MLASCSYQVLMQLKSIIKQELPSLSHESRAMGEQTDSILRQGGYMMTIAEAAKNPRLLELEGVGSVVSMSASSDSVYKIPVLAMLLKRSNRSQRCTQCRLHIYEVNIQDQRKWQRTMSQCVGQSPDALSAWGLHLLNFPLEFSGGCTVHSQICINCLRSSIGSVKYVANQSPTLISCPSWGCGCQYVLKHGLIRACLEPGVRKGYDRAFQDSELISKGYFVWKSPSRRAWAQVCGDESWSLCSGQPSE